MAAHQVERQWPRMQAQRDALESLSRQPLDLTKRSGRGRNVIQCSQMCFNFEKSPYKIAALGL